MLGIFLDTETNGLDFRKARVLEIAFKIIDLRSHEELLSFDTIIKQPKEVWDLSDPVSLSINGFKFEDLADGLTEDQVFQKITSKFDELRICRNKAVFICQNPSFDRAFFTQLIPSEEQEERKWPYHWLDLASMFWLSYIRETGHFPMNVGLSKDKIAHYYKLPPENKPHKALNGVNHLIDCYFALLSSKKQLKT
ncbi:MAG: 3'-5' exonuclease [Rhabdochlamydiaceae bacterium]|nr:3'-5' exonuclease [Candidatus Amphrikana amoebophyrae]